MLHQAHAPKKKNATKCMSGVKTPHNCQEALSFDEAHGNTFWEDETEKEIDHIKACNTFQDIDQGVRAPSGCQKVCAHLICANEFDIRRKARLVLSGQLTQPSNDESHSGIVSLWLNQMSSNCVQQTLHKPALKPPQERNWLLLLAQNLELSLATRLFSLKHHMEQGPLATGLQRSLQMICQIFISSRASMILLFG